LKTLKLVNVNSQTWNNREAKVYIKAYTKGDVAAYKQIAVKYTSNKPPTIGGDTGPWEIVVNEADDNAGQTQEFTVLFKDPEGDAIVDYSLNAGFSS